MILALLVRKYYRLALTVSIRDKEDKMQEKIYDISSVTTHNATASETNT